MIHNKKNNWLKFKTDFFQSLALKKIRRIAGGDTYLIIYQKLMLLTVNTEGHYEFQKFEPTIAEELALIIDEDVENIRVAMNFLSSTNLMQYIDNYGVFFNEVPKLIGKYEDSSERVTKYRLRKKEEHECNALHSLQVTVMSQNVTLLEKEREKEKERELESSAREKSETRKLIEKNSVETWKMVIEEMELKFKSDEWFAIEGYAMAKPHLALHTIKMELIQLDKWANEGLDIIDSLLNSGNTKALIRPKMSIVYDKRGNRIYGQDIVKQRNSTIKGEHNAEGI